MSFWDASALVPALLDELMSVPVRLALRRDSDVTVWWATQVECASAIERRSRESGLSPSERGSAYERLADLAVAWREVAPSPPLRDEAIAILTRHPLRAADALQLAAAYAFSEGDPPTLEFVSLDSRLVAAARREGFRIVDFGDA